MTGGWCQIRVRFDSGRAIIDAGGEWKEVGTLEKYRKTALHFRGNPPKFRWVKGYSYSAHEEAYKTGISADDFIANPMTLLEQRTIAYEAKQAEEREEAKAEANRTPERISHDEFERHRLYSYHAANRMATEAENVLKAVKEATASAHWDRHIPSEEVERSHGEYVLADIDLGIEALHQLRVEAAKLVDAADKRAAKREESGRSA